ncbi:DB domain-containing protein [Aphelenchoides fujianensis]|nr:DB domain-containing protein [Aphelenchoides fujianensis]
MPSGRRANGSMSSRLLFSAVILSSMSLALAVPHIPQVVFPSKDRPRPTADGISRAKNTGSTVDLAARPPLIAAQQDASSAAESRIVLAPIEGKQVYTMDRYLITSSERVVEPKPPAKPRTALAAAKTQTQQPHGGGRPVGVPAISQRGVSVVNEVIAVGDLTRTTMAESSAPSGRFAADSSNGTTTTTAAPISSSSSTPPASPKNKEQLASLRNVQLVSHDTSRASSEVRYPAKDWQLPPQLLSARSKSKALDTNTIKAGDYAAEVPSGEEVEGAYEEALSLYTKTQLGGLPPLKTRKFRTEHRANQTTAAGVGFLPQRPPPFAAPPAGPPIHSGPNAPAPTLQHVVKSIDQMIEKAFGEKKPRPKMSFVNGDQKKFRATFAAHRGDKQAIPLPGGPFADESDMDLLVEGTRRPGGLSAGGVQSAPNPRALPPPTAPLQRPVPIQTPVVATSAVAQYVPVDPNYKLDLCCRKQQISSVCQNMCNFDTFTDRSLVTAVLGGQCPGPQLGQAFDCASSKADHTECCTRNNLHLYAGGQCMPFCRTHVPTPPNLISYIACLQVFDTIKNCYREYSYTHPNIYGD